MKVATYLKFTGNCEEALQTYKEVFAGDELCLHKYSEGMTNDNNLIGKVFHAELKVDNFYFYMSDTSENFDYERQAYKVTIETDTLEEAQQYYENLQKHGEVLDSFSQKPWGMHSGHVRDKYGITWDLVFCK